MASTWITIRYAADGSKRYRVMWRFGPRSTHPRYGGSFKTRREAKLRRDWIAGELAANRIPKIGRLSETPSAPTLATAAKRWQDSRVDVAEATRVQHRTALNRILPILGSRHVDELVPADVADLVTQLASQGKARESIRKSVTALAMVLDHAGVTPNPARDRVTVKLPREEPEEFNPPTADHVEAVYRRIPEQHRLALLFLDWSGARVAAIDHVLVGDYDQPRRRVRLRAATTKTRRALWVELHPALAEAIERCLPHPRFREPDARLFADSGADALRTAISKACKAEAIPLWSPHDLRHRRISLLHVLVDETELDYEKLLAHARP